MALIRNPSTGEISIADDPTGLLEQGYELATPEQAEDYAKQVDFGTVGQTAQALGERVVRGGTLGLVEGFGSDEDIQARADVSQEQHPALSFAADVVPDIAVGALTGGIGEAAAGAARLGKVASGVAGLAAESLGSGAVMAGQEAFAEGRDAWTQDLGRDAENALLWGGLNFGLGSVGLAREGLREARAAKAGTRAVDEGLEDIAHAEEARSFRPELEAGEPPPAQLGAGGDPLGITPGPAYPELPPAGNQLNPLESLNGAEPPQGAAITAEGQAVGEFAPPVNTAPVNPAIDAAADQGNAAVTAGPELGRTGRIAELSRAFNEATGLDAGTVGAAGAIAGAGALEGEGDDNGAQQAGLGLLGAMLLGGKLFRGAGRDAAKHAVDDGLERAVRNASRADADDVVTRVVKGAADEPSSFGRQRRLYQNRGAIYDAAGRELGEAMGEVVKGADGALDRGLASAAKKVGPNAPAQLDAARSVAEDAARFAGGLRAEAREYATAAGEAGHRYPVQGAKAFSIELMNQAKELANAGTGREAFELLGKFRETASRFASKLADSADKALDPERARALQSKVLDFSAQIRKTLERQDTWGAAGEMAAAHHAVDDQLRPALEALGKGWERSLGAALKGTDPAKRDAVLGALKAAQELGGVESRFGDAALGKKLGDATSKARRTLGLADEVADASERMGAINDVTPDLLNQFITGDVVGKFRRLAGATDAALGRNVDEWILSSRVPGKSLVPKLFDAEDSALMATAKRRGVSRGMALFLGEDDSPTSAFLKARESLQDEERFFKTLGNDFRSLQQHAPEAFMVLSAQASVGRQFLLSKMPANVASSMANPMGRPPSRDSIEEWSVYWNAVRFPRMVSRNIGAMRGAEVDTIRTVYPRYFEKLQQKALESLGRAQAMGHRIDDTVAFRLGNLFDIDGPGSVAFSQAAAKTARTYAKEQGQQLGGGAPKPPKPPSNAGTLQGVMQNGPTFGGTGF